MEYDFKNCWQRASGLISASLICLSIMLTTAPSDAANSAVAVPLLLDDNSPRPLISTPVADGKKLLPNGKAKRVKFNAELALAIPAGAIASISIDGKAERVIHDKTIHHPSGNQTWLGHLDGTGYGTNYPVVITSGKRATAGSMSTPNGKFNLQQQTDGLYLSDAKELQVAPEHTGKEKFKTAKLSAPAAANLAKTLHAAAINAAPNPAVKNVFDVMLLVSNDYVNQVGPEWQTRIDYLVSVAQQAYDDSNVGITLRQVATRTVDYPFNYDFQAASVDLTPWTVVNSRFVRDPSRNPHPAFQNVDNLRQAYGADFYALVQPYRFGGGCGNAPIDEWKDLRQGLGFAVIGDGIDTDSSTGIAYACDDTTLAHELGHAMGLQHDAINANLTFGSFRPYSLGYVVPNLFHTVMAYPQGSSVRAGKFSSPDLLCFGQPCGVANVADNARSLNELRQYAAVAQPTQVNRATQLIGLADKCLNANTIVPANAPLSIYDCVGSVAQQQWNVEDRRIKGIGGLCVQTANHSLANGTALHLWPCSDTDNGGIGQHWKFNLNGSLESLDAPGSCIDVAGNNSANETPLLLWTCHGGANQHWQARGRVVGLAGKCLDINTNTGGYWQGMLSSCVDGKPAQNWTLDQDRIKGWYGLCLASENYSLANGTRMQLVWCDGGAGERWKQNANGSLESLDMAGQCIDVNGANSNNGTQIIVWQCHGRENQRWDFLNRFRS